MAQKLPKQIQAEIDEAEALERMFAEQQNPVPAENAAGEGAAEAVVPAEGIPPGTPEAVAEDANSETWEQRYRILQGKYDAEVPRLHAQVRELTDNLNQVAQRLQSEPVEAPKPLSEVAPEDIETYGEDLVNMMRRVAAAEAERRSAEALQRVNQVEGHLAQGQEDRFYSALSQRVPQWKDIDNEPGWISWLGEYDPMVGSSRQDALNAAARALDSNRVASIFETYVLTRQQNRPGAAPSVMQSQVVPRSQGVAPGAAQQKRVYTQAEIAQLLDPRHILHLPEDQQRAIERDIDLAVAEGRIAA